MALRRLHVGKAVGFSLFVCLFLIGNCMLSRLRSAGHREFSWAEERGSSPTGAGVEGRTEVRPGAPGTPLMSLWWERAGLGDPAGAFLCKRETWAPPVPDGCKATAGSRGRPGGFPRSRAAARGGRRCLQPPGAGALDAAFPQVVLLENQMLSQAFQTLCVKQDHRRSRGCRICKSLPFHLSKERGLRMGCIKYQKTISAALQS